jgi:hypothetical protein
LRLTALSGLLAGRPLLAALFLLTLPFVTTRIRGADEIEYFSYLRSLGFDRDLEFGNEYQHFYDLDPGGLAGFKGTFLDKRETETGRHINFGPMGSAMLWSPFYALAHAVVLAARALGSSVPADGFSRPYQAAVCYGSALYGFLGLALVHDALRRRAGREEPAASWAVAALWLATPVLYYMTVAPGFSHACSLFAVALLVWLWLRAAETDTLAGWTLVGAAGGLCGLVREQDALFLAAPAAHLLWQTSRRRDWARLLPRLAGMGAAAFVVFLPQLLVYKVLTGGYHPSRMVSGKLHAASPHFLEVLFDPGHGLFVWSPLLLLATVGLGWIAVRGRDGVAALLGLAFLMQVWICGALDTWTQAGAFGSRRFVSSTAAFAWGLAALLALPRPRLGRALAALALALFAWWNVSLMVQFGLRLMDRQRLEWPRVAVNQVTQVPPRLGRVLWLFFTDRERLAKEGV